MFEVVPVTLEQWTPSIITSMAAGHYFIALLRLGQLNDPCVSVWVWWNYAWVLICLHLIFGCNPFIHTIGWFIPNLIEIGSLVQKPPLGGGGGVRRGNSQNFSFQSIHTHPRMIHTKFHWNWSTGSKNPLWGVEGGVVGKFETFWFQPIHIYLRLYHTEFHRNWPTGFENPLWG